MVSAFISLQPLTAHAEIKEGSTEVGVFGGYNWFQNNQNLKDGPMFGGRVGYNFTKHFGMEAVGEYIDSSVDDRSLTGGSEGQFRGPTNSVDLTLYHLDAVYHFMPDGRFNPFVVVGFGLTHYNPDISDKEMAAFNVGVGAKYWLTENIALRADLRDYIVTEIFQETFHNVGASVGITFRFGGKGKPAPVQEAKYVPKPAPVIVTPAAEPKVEEKVVVVAPAPEVIVLAFEDIHFDFDKSTLTPEAKRLLKKNIQILKENPKTQVRISGYTSAAGSQAYNQKLSERRAEAVKTYLVEEGIITPDRLITVGYGETIPAVHEAAPEALTSPAAKANMRVLFEIIVQ
jgi:OOP family OmpA-OmpF porin